MDDLKHFFQKVYGWMFLGLAISGLAAYLAAFNPTVNKVVMQNPWMMFALIILELLLVIFMSFLIKKMSPTAATLCFLIFALVNGLTLSIIFVIYSISSIAMAFFLTAGLFGLMSLIGMITGVDLSKIGTICFFGLIGVIIASIVNFFIHSTTAGYVISAITIIIFIGLTAYDTQMLKRLASSGIENANEEKKLSIFGALKLYLDFINLFLNILRIFGRAK